MFTRKINKFITRPLEFISDIKNPIVKLFYIKNSKRIRDFIIRFWPSEYYNALYSHFLKSREYELLFLRKGNSDVSFATLPWTPKGHQIYVGPILGAKKIGFPKNIKKDKIDVFTTWGMTIAPKHNKISLVAEHKGRPVVRLEYGFIAGKDVAALDSPQCSLLMSPWVMYYDSSRPTFMDFLLNSKWKLSKSQLQNVKSQIKTIVDKKLTKYNAGKHQFARKIPVTGNKRVLLIDQRKGDLSVSYGGASEETFDEMFNAAYAKAGYDVIIKVHPDALKGGFGSYLAKYVDYDPKRVFVVSEDINPYVLLKECEEVFVVVSGMGFEAAMLGKPVTCFGSPFYSGWGFTNDIKKKKYRDKKRSVEEFFYIYYDLCTRYYLPGKGQVDLSTFLEGFPLYLQDKLISDPVISEPKPCAPELKVMFFIPSPRSGATGINCQKYALELRKLGIKSQIYAEGNHYGDNDGISWNRIRFAGKRLDPGSRQKILSFNPDIIYLWGCRTKAQRAALEALILTDAKLVLHCEDDDEQIFKTKHPEQNSSTLKEIDGLQIDQFTQKRLFSDFNITHLINVINDVNYDRWVDPILRYLCLKLSAGYTGIWKPFTEELQNTFKKKSLLLPPVFMREQLPQLNIEEARESLCLKYSIDPDSIIIFINGNIYTYSDEFKFFLKYLSVISSKFSKKIHLMFISKTDEHKNIFKENYDGSYSFTMLENLNDYDYQHVMMGSDIMASPGLSDTFTKYRVPSRFVVPMACGKPVLVHRMGFGESLVQGKNAIILNETDDINSWAFETEKYFTFDALKNIGRESLAFANQYFDVAKNAQLLANYLNEVKSTGIKPFQ